MGNPILIVAKCTEKSIRKQRVNQIHFLQIQRYGTLSQLYSQIGFKRKSSFYKRVSAMQCVAPQNPKQNWHQCYYLLIQALEGYKITLDPKEMRAHGGRQITFVSELFSLFWLVMVKSGKFGRSAKFGQRPCLFHILTIGIKNKLTKQTVKILMRRLIRSRLIWISTVCKCMFKFT